MSGSCCSSKKAAGCGCVKDLMCFIVSSIVVFLFITAFEYVFHVVLMMPQYQATAELWRSDMVAYSQYVYIGQLLVAMACVWLFKLTQKKGGCGDKGACGCKSASSCCMFLGFPTALGFFFAAESFVWYAYLPVEFPLIGFWMLGGFVKGLGVGALLTLMASCKKKSCCKDGQKDACCKSEAKPVAFGNDETVCCNSEKKDSDESHGCCRNHDS